MAGAILSAAGIGALISPPTLGAAAFLIAEFLKISYLQVLVMAIIPTLLYYLSIFLMIAVASFATRELKAWETFAAGVALVVMSWSIFILGLGLPIPVWPDW